MPFVPRRLFTFLLAGGAIGASIIIGTLLGEDRPARTLAGQPPAAAKPAPPPQLTPRQLIGLDRLEQRLGRQTPTGKGVIAGHAEGAPSDYMPNVTSDRFKSVHFTAASGPSEPNGHSDSTSLIIFGSGGLAPGIEQVVCFTSNHFITSGYLHGGTDHPPATTPLRVFTHSWIGNASNGTSEVLRRLDYLADHDNVVFVVGVNNGRDTPVPALLSSAYNAISVGNWDGNSSGGYTRFEGEGRCKPEIVAPMGLVSFATPVVAACAARLIEAADRLGNDHPAHRVAVIKALLMAGADKTPNWKQEAGKPLDTRLGAGRVRIDRSFAILEAGAAEPGAVAGRYGWAYQPLEKGKSHAYTFEVSHTLGEASIMLVWNRRIDGRQARDLLNGTSVWLGAPRMADLDLKLTREGENGEASVVAASDGNTDNVEHIYLKELPHGRYTIEVARKDGLEEAWDYALAWRIENARPTEPQQAAVKGP